MSGVAPRLRRALALGLVSLSLSTLAPAAANAATDPEIPAAAADPAPDDLRPGQYRWHPEASPAEGPVSIVVSIPLQRA